MIEAIIKFGLRSRLLVLALGVLVAGAGFYSYRQLPVDAFPDVSPNLVQVFAEVDGMAPEEVEQLVTRPTETAMRSIAGVHARDLLALVDAQHPGLVGRFGGHAMAAGLSLDRSNLDRFTDAALAAVAQVADAAENHRR